MVHSIVVEVTSPQTQCQYEKTTVIEKVHKTGVPDCVKITEVQCNNILLSLTRWSIHIPILKSVESSLNSISLLKMHHCHLQLSLFQLRPWDWRLWPCLMMTHSSSMTVCL